MVVAAHVGMMDRIAAEETQVAVSVVTVARFVKSGEWVRTFLKSIERIASGRRRRKAGRPSDLLSLGIGTKKVKRGG